MIAVASSGAHKQTQVNLRRRPDQKAIANSLELLLAAHYDVYFLNYLIALHSAGLPVLRNQALATSHKQQGAWVASGYTKKDIAQASKVMEERFTGVEEMLANFNEALFYQYAAYVGTQVPIVDSIEDAKYKTHEFSDCGATSLRNFFHFVLWDDEANALNPQYLTQMGLPVDSRLKDFFKRHNSIETILSDQLHHDWAEVVSGLPGVAYLSPPDSPVCEIGAGLRNMLAVIAHLLFAGDASFAKLTVDEKLNMICKKLSREGFELSWDSDHNVNLEENDTKITLEFEINGDEAFEWEFKPGHFLIKIDHVTELEAEERREAAAQKLNASKPGSRDALKLTSRLLLSFDKPVSFLDQITGQYKYLFFFNMPLERYHYVLTERMEKIRNSSLVYKPEYEKLMLTLGRPVPRDAHELGVGLGILAGTYTSKEVHRPDDGYAQRLLTKHARYLDSLVAKYDKDELYKAIMVSLRFGLAFPVFKFLLDKLVQRGFDVHEPNLKSEPYGLPILPDILAAMKWSIHYPLKEHIAYVIEKGADLSITYTIDGKYFDPLMQAYNLVRQRGKDFLVLFDLLIEKGGSVNYRVSESGQTLLIHAVRDGEKEIVKRLLQAGANPTIQDSEGKRAVDYAQGEIKDLFLEK